MTFKHSGMHSRFRENPYREILRLQLILSKLKIGKMNGQKPRKHRMELCGDVIKF